MPGGAEGQHRETPGASDGLGVRGGGWPVSTRWDGPEKRRRTSRRAVGSQPTSDLPNLQGRDHCHPLALLDETRTQHSAAPGGLQQEAGKKSENTLGCRCQSSFHLSEMCVCVCVCLPQLCGPMLFDLLFSLCCFSFCFFPPLLMPCHTGFLFLSLKQARYISNQPL